MSSKWKVRLIISVSLLLTILFINTFIRSSQKEATMKEVITLLQSPDIQERCNALDKLKEIKEKGLTVKAGQIALESAVKEFPPLEPDYYDTSKELVSAAVENPHTDYIPIISKNYSKYNSRSKAEALRLLTVLGTNDAIITFMNLLDKYGRTDVIPKLPVGSLIEKPKLGELIFPDILKLIDIEQYEWDILECTLAYVQNKAIDSDTLSKCKDAILKKYLQYKDDVFNAQQNGRSWIWFEEYQSKREILGILLDIMGYFSSYDVNSELREALSLKDERLQMFALISLLRLGGEINNEIIKKVAKTAENRIILYDELCKLGKKSLFPEQFRTQVFFAESNMVNWLIYPTELGREPDEIELMEVIPQDPKDGYGIREYYIFRFRTMPPHWAAEDGWMAGISGPYLRKEIPTTKSYGYTFSCFEPWESKTPKEHLKEIQEVINQ